MMEKVKNGTNQQQLFSYVGNIWLGQVGVATPKK